MDTMQKLKLAVKALDDKKAEDIKIIKIDDLTILGDYFVIATGNSSTQVKALADEVDYVLSQEGIEPGRVEGKSSGWVLIDYGEVVVHVFYIKDREFYDLEKMWEDGKKIDVASILD